MRNKLFIFTLTIINMMCMVSCAKNEVSSEVITYNENTTIEVIHEETIIVETTAKEEASVEMSNIYKFNRAEHMDMIYQSERLNEKYGNVVESCICRLFDEEKEICPSEKDCALILGRIWALFGEPDDPKMYEDFYSYVIAAENEQGDVLYLNIYQYSGMPSVGGPIGEGFENYEIAAAQLAELIYSTEPVDYEWSGSYEDYDVYIKYSVENGIAKYEDSYAKMLEAKYGFDPYELNKFLDKIFADMTAEEINAWVEEYDTFDKMVEFIRDNPQLFE